MESLETLVNNICEVRRGEVDWGGERGRWTGEGRGGLGRGEVDWGGEG